VTAALKEFPVGHDAITGIKDQPLSLKKDCSLYYYHPTSHFPGKRFLKISSTYPTITITKSSKFHPFLT
jgi:hypothetical protein